MQRILGLLLAVVALTAVACSDDDPSGPIELVAVVLSSNGIGSGAVTATPGNLDCDITDGAESGICAIAVPPGTSITFTAAPANGMAFAGWGDDCAAQHIAIECTIVASQPVSVTAAFVPAVRNDLLYLSGPANLGELRRRFGGSNQTHPVLPAGSVVFDVATNWDGNTVAIVRRDNIGLFSTWTMKPDGTNLVARLVSNDFHNRMPSFSPDGQRVAFMSTRESSGGDVWVANVDGTNAQNLTPELPGIVTADRNPVWSPDGTSIAFISSREGFSTLWLMNADGTNQRRVTTGIAGELEVTWSPDSRKVAFTRPVPGGESDIVIRDLMTGEELRIERAGHERYPAWSPDGSRIAFAWDTDGDYEIWTMAPDGTQLSRITDNEVADMYPVWLRARGPAPGM